MTLNENLVMLLALLSGFLTIYLLSNAYIVFKYRKWLRLRNSSKDVYNRKLCYCGRTYKCLCEDPDCVSFKRHVKNGNLILNKKEIN